MPSHPVALSALLEHQATIRATDEALTDGRVRLTWAGYRDRAASLAGALAANGVRAGDRVVIHLPKSVNSFVAAHAIVRLGAIVVPVDFFAPAAHVADVIGDAEPAAVISSVGKQRLAEIMASGSTSTPMPVVVGPDAEGVAAAISDVGPRAAAYIVYTSGSTGRPKGIVHSHASALAYARKAVATYDIMPDDRLANIAPLHFDQSTFELWAAPLAGAAAIVVPDGVLRFPASVSDLVARERATVWYSVPFAITQLVDRGAADERDLSSLRWVLFGGESFPPAALSAARRAVPAARFSNVYGPAEVNQCTFHHLDCSPDGFDLAASGTSDVSVPIGRPWADTEMLLVDDEDRALDGAVVGELLVSTDTMMDGYWRRPELTARSICTRSDTGTTRRWYRTGDLVRRDADGMLFFIGRTDHQVKVRGHRIEIEAVEAVVAEASEVTACAVLVERGSEDRLVALVTPARDDTTSVIALVRSRLPRYAVPAEVIGVESLPRTGTGKVDRVAASSLLADIRRQAESGPSDDAPVNVSR